MIEHRCEYKYTALVHTDACLGVHYYIRTCSNQCRLVYIMRVNFYFIKKFLYYALLSTECYPFASNLKKLKIRAPNFCRNFIYIVLLLEIFFF